MRRLLSLVALSAGGLLFTSATGQTALSADASRPITMSCSWPVLDVGTGA